MSCEQEHQKPCTQDDSDSGSECSGDEGVKGKKGKGKGQGKGKGKGQEHGHGHGHGGQGQCGKSDQHKKK
ncbi:hypothetical protein IRJ41_007443 [Triplophysa rosa]|uniref:Uncharacterized protein n=1 Tax=Triplophysa rosa TaxID=992332 RepID=A0A9W7TXG9_TRIRA|nr:hypothetical protein IRJ41_007443 [Triplophysa rosa]